MDKLKPVLEQKFWIFTGLALLLPLIGWFIATKTYATGVEERETAIDGAFSRRYIRLCRPILVRRPTAADERSERLNE